MDRAPPPCGAWLIFQPEVPVRHGTVAWRPAWQAFVQAWVSVASWCLPPPAAFGSSTSWLSHLADALVQLLYSFLLQGIGLSSLPFPFLFRTVTSLETSTREGANGYVRISYRWPVRMFSLCRVRIVSLCYVQILILCYVRMSDLCYVRILRLCRSRHWLAASRLGARFARVATDPVKRN